MFARLNGGRWRTRLTVEQFEGRVVPMAQPLEGASDPPANPPAEVSDSPAELAHPHEPESGEYEAVSPGDAPAPELPPEGWLEEWAEIELVVVAADGPTADEPPDSGGDPLSDAADPPKGGTVEVAPRVETPPQVPPPPRVPPTSGTLGWNDFRVVNAAKFDAFTAGRIDYNRAEIKSDGHATFVPYHHHVVIAHIDLRFTATFDRGQSFVLAGRQTAELFAHERLHLRIAEYVATKATLNAADGLKQVVIEDLGVASGAAARNELVKKLDAYRDKVRAAVVELSKLYDDGVKVDGVIDPEKQRDWERTYIDKVDTYLKEKLGWQK